MQNLIWQKKVKFIYISSLVMIDEANASHNTIILVVEEVGTRFKWSRRQLYV